MQGNFRTAGAAPTGKGGLSRGAAPDTLAQTRTAGMPGAGKALNSRLTSSYVTPNPASGSATLHYKQPLAGLVRVRILDLSGTLRAEALPFTQAAAGAHSVALPLRSLPPGLYLITLETATGREFVRLELQ